MTFGSNHDMNMCVHTSESLGVPQGCPALVLLTFGLDKSLLLRWGGVPCKIFANIPDLYILDVLTPLPKVGTTKMSPDIAKCLLGWWGRWWKTAPG